VERADIHFPTEPPVVAKRKSGSHGKGVFRAGEVPAGYKFLIIGLLGLMVSLTVNHCLHVYMCLYRTMSVGICVSISVCV
jgi:hypothetical protein